MTEAFIIQNQHNLYLDKHGEWIEPTEKQAMYRTTHRDEAINTKVEQSVRNPELRLTIVTCTLNEKGQVCLPEASNDHSSSALNEPKHIAPKIDPAEPDLFSLVNEPINDHSQSNTDTDQTN